MNKFKKVTALKNEKEKQTQKQRKPSEHPRKDKDTKSEKK
jgi:hypothetical protein